MPAQSSLVPIKLTRAFIFDMDGVLIDSESAWIPCQTTFSTNLFGKKIYEKIGSTIGLSIDTIYQRAQQHGFAMNMEEYYAIYDAQASSIYSVAMTTNGLAELISFLKSSGYSLGLVSSSRRKWIDMVLTKLQLGNPFNCVISLNDEKHIRPKPAPDGYITAMDMLGAEPEQTIILEDSNSGISSALASGAYTIAYTEHLTPGSKQLRADAMAANMSEVREIVRARLRRSVTSHTQGKLAQ